MKEFDPEALKRWMLGQDDGHGLHPFRDAVHATGGAPRTGPGAARLVEALRADGGARVIVDLPRRHRRVRIQTDAEVSLILADSAVFNVHPGETAVAQDGCAYAESNERYYPAGSMRLRLARSWVGRFASVVFDRRFTAGDVALAVLVTAFSVFFGVLGMLARS